MFIVMKKLQFCGATLEVKQEKDTYTLNGLEPLEFFMKIDAWDGISAAGWRRRLRKLLVENGFRVHQTIPEKTQPY